MAPEIRIYAVVAHEDADGEVWYECALCGKLEGAVARGHGPEHIVEDASQ